MTGEDGKTAVFAVQLPSDSIQMFPTELPKNQSFLIPLIRKP